MELSPWSLAAPSGSYLIYSMGPTLTQTIGGQEGRRCVRGSYLAGLGGGPCRRPVLLVLDALARKKSTRLKSAKKLRTTVVADREKKQFSRYVDRATATRSRGGEMCE